MWLLLAAAAAADPAPPVVVLPVGGVGAEPLEATLRAAGWDGAERVGAEVIAERVGLVSVVDRGADADCGGEVDVDAWRAGLDDARRELQVLALEGALASYLARELEMVCLARPPANADLLRVELGVATAHHFLALQHRGDAVRAGFHDAESRRALDRALAVGRGLALPPDTDPEIARAWAAAAEPAGDARWVVVAGPGVLARVDGRPVGTGVVGVGVGSHLVQAVDGSRVVAARLVEARADDLTVLWLADGGDRLPADAIPAAVRRVGAGPGDEDRRLLGAVAALSGPPGGVGFAAEGPDGVTVWRPDGPPLGPGRPATPAVVAPSPRARPWQLTVAAGGAGSTLQGGAAEGLGGVGPAVVLGVDHAVGSHGRAGVRLRPGAVPRRLAPWDGGGILFRATVPVLAAVGWGWTRGPVDVELGVEGGVHLLGAFERFEVRGVGLARAGVGPADGLPWWVEAWVGPGTGYVAGGVSVGIRWRP